MPDHKFISSLIVFYLPVMIVAVYFQDKFSFLKIEISEVRSNSELPYEAYSSLTLPTAGVPQVSPHQLFSLSIVVLQMRPELFFVHSLTLLHSRFNIIKSFF